jgi:hypothetical protein
MTKPSTLTKTDLYRMLAEAVRNTQPQPVDSPPEPSTDIKSGSKRKSPARNKRAAPKRTTKTKSNPAAAGRKRQPR